MTPFGDWKNRLSYWRAALPAGQGRGLVAGGIFLLVLNLLVGALELRGVRDSAAQALQVEFNGIRGHLRSVVSVMVLDSYLMNSVESANYAESMRTIVPFHDGKIADVIALYHLNGEIYADAGRAGYFGLRDSLSPLVLEAATQSDPLDAVVRRDGHLYLFSLLSASSLNGRVGTVVVGTDLERHFAELEWIGAFPIEHLDFSTSARDPVPLGGHAFPGIQGFHRPADWEIRGKIPAWSRLLAFILARTVLVMVVYGAFLSMWLGYVAAKEKLRNEHTMRVNSARLVALGEMSAGIVQEINSPLAAIHIGGYQLGELLRRHELPADFLADATLISECIGRTVKRISTIIKGLQTFARDGSKMPMSEARVSQIVRDTLEICSARLSYGSVDLRLNLDAHDDRVKCSSVQLSQVILNMLNNSFDAIEDTAGAWISLELYRRPKAVELWITDSGPGIPREIRQKIMEPFFTTKPVGKGTGIGLSIAKGIMETHGGDLQLDPYCTNTRFIMQLPAET